MIAPVPHTPPLLGATRQQPYARTPIIAAEPVRFGSNCHARLALGTGLLGSVVSLIVGITGYLSVGLNNSQAKDYKTLDNSLASVTGTTTLSSALSESQHQGELLSKYLREVHQRLAVPQNNVDTLQLLKQLDLISARDLEATQAFLAQTKNGIERLNHEEVYNQWADDVMSRYTTPEEVKAAKAQAKLFFEDMSTARERDKALETAITVSIGSLFGGVALHALLYDREEAQVERDLKHLWA